MGADGSRDSAAIMTALIAFCAWFACVYPVAATHGSSWDASLALQLALLAVHIFLQRRLPVALNATLLGMAIAGQFKAITLLSGIAQCTLLILWFACRYAAA